MSIEDDENEEIVKQINELPTMNEIFAQEDAYMLEHPQEYSMSISIMNESLAPNRLSRLSNCSTLETINEEQDGSPEQESVSPVPKIANTNLPKECPKHHDENRDENREKRTDKGFLELTKEKNISQEPMNTRYGHLARFSAPVYKNVNSSESTYHTLPKDPKNLSNHKSSIVEPKRVVSIQNTSVSKSIGPKKPSSVLVFDPHTKPFSTLPTKQNENENSQEKAKPSTPIVNRNSSIPTKRDPIPSRDSLLNYSHTRESGSLPMQRQSMPVNRPSTSTSIKPRTSIFTRKSDMGMNERKEESAQKRVEELARENARLRNELDKAHADLMNAEIRIKSLEKEIKQLKYQSTRYSQT